MAPLSVATQRVFDDRLQRIAGISVTQGLSESEPPALHQEYGVITPLPQSREWRQVGPGYWYWLCIPWGSQGYDSTMRQRHWTPPASWACHRSPIHATNIEVKQVIYLYFS